MAGLTIISIGVAAFVGWLPCRTQRQGSKSRQLHGLLQTQVLTVRTADQTNAETAATDSSIELRDVEAQPIDEPWALHQALEGVGMHPDAS